jgi:hypothetical protein
MNELIKAYKAYIKFLGKDISDNAIYLMIHGMSPSPEKIKKGSDLRRKIADLEKKFNIT